MKGAVRVSRVWSCEPVDICHLSSIGHYIRGPRKSEKTDTDALIGRV